MVFLLLYWAVSVAHAAPVTPWPRSGSLLVDSRGEVTTVVKTSSNHSGEAASQNNLTLQNHDEHLLPTAVAASGAASPRLLPADSSPYVSSPLSAAAATETLLRSEERHAVQPALPSLRPSERLYEHMVKMTHTKEEDQQDLFRGFYHLPLLMCAGVLCFLCGSFLEPYVPKGKVLAMLLCGIYVACSVVVGVSIKVLSDHATPKHKIASSGSRHFAFDPLCLVATTELSKISITSVLLAATYFSQRGAEHSQTVAQLSTADLYRFAAPAACFTLGSILAFAAIGANDVSVFGIFQQTGLLWTTAFWKIRFRAELGWSRSAAVALCFSGLCLNQVSQLSANGRFLGSSVGWILLMTQSNSLGAVLNEHVLKHNTEVDINIQNIMLYSMSFLFSIMLLLTVHPTKLRSAHDFFSGFSSLSWTLVGLQACTSLVVTRLLKYADSIIKTFATCLQGPVLVVAAPFFVRSTFTKGHLFSTIVVFAGCCWYLLQGPLDTVEEPLDKVEEPPSAPPILNDCWVLRQDRYDRKSPSKRLTT